MFSLGAVESALHRVSRCSHSCVCNPTFLYRQITKKTLPSASKCCWSSSTPSSLQQIHQQYSPFLLSPSTAEPCSRLLAALPARQETRRTIHHSALSCTRTSTPLLKSSKPKIDRSLVPELLETDLKESFIKGWGPGGQSVNKTNNAVLLKHMPTGLFVKVHMHRMQHKNALEARLLLQEKLDDLVNGPMSVSAQRARLLERKSARSESKAKKMRDLKAQWKQSQGVTGAVDVDGVTDEGGCADTEQGLPDGGGDMEKGNSQNKTV